MTNEYEQRQRERSEWLANLKPGDEVAIPGRWSVGATSLLRVERLTATQIVVAGGRKFRRDSGRAVGTSDTWNTPWLQPVTQEVLDAIEHKRLVDWLDSVNRNRNALTVEALRAMKAAHDANKAKKK
jgi:Zn-dependent alcohol dehydrogenase